MRRDIERLAEFGESCLRERMSEIIDRVKRLGLRYKSYETLGNFDSLSESKFVRQNFIEAIEEYRKMIAEMQEYGLKVKKYHDIVADITSLFNKVDLAEAIRRQRRLKKARDEAWRN